MDCDQAEQGCGIEEAALKTILEKTMEIETELLRTYTITAEQLHDREDLRIRLQNFAEGNAKRSRQLQDELDRIVT